MLQPKRSKYRKEFRGKMRGMSHRGHRLAFGKYGLKATTRDWVTSRQIEAARRSIANYTKRAGKIYIRIFPHKPVTARAAGSRMGGGKGDIDKYVAVVKPGRILIEIAGVDRQIAREALRRAGHKLPVKTKFITRQ